MWTVNGLRAEVHKRLGDAQEAKLLLSLMLDCEPSQLMIDASQPVADARARAVLVATQRRLDDEPLAYCTGKAPFRHLVLNVDARVLIPRPETEILVDEVLRITHDAPGGIAIDIGTGSGAIAISLATEGMFDRVIATDVSADALDVARANAAVVPGAGTVEFRLGAGLVPIRGVRGRVLASNPPYIAYDEASELPRSVRDWEPPLALFAADGGMAMYDLLLQHAPNHLEPGGWVVLEVDSRRADETMARARNTGHYGDIRVVRDLSGRQRVLVARLSE